MTTPTPPVTLEDVENFAKDLDEYVKIKLKDKNLVFNALSDSKSTIQFSISQVESIYEVNVFDKNNKPINTEKTNKPISKLKTRLGSLLDDPCYMLQLLLKISSLRDDDRMSKELNSILASLNIDINEFEKIKSYLYNKNIKYDDTSTNNFPSLLIKHGDGKLSIKLIKNEYFCSCKVIKHGSINNNELSARSSFNPTEYIKHAITTL